MKASDPRYHVGLGLILEQHEDEFSFDRSASLADLWRILFHNLLHHPIKTTFLSRRYMHGAWSRRDRPIPSTSNTTEEEG